MGRSRTSGLGLVEVILAAAIFVVILAGVLGAYGYSERAGILTGERSRALTLAEEGIEAARSLRDGSFSTMTPGTFGVATSSSGWVLTGTSTTQGDFTRSLAIVATSTNRVQIQSTVTWVQNGRRTGTVSLTSWLTNWAKLADWLAPSIAGGLDLTSSTIAVEVATAGNYAYLVRNTGTGVPNFAIVNVSNPASPTLTSSLTLNGPLTDVVINGNYALISSGDDAREFQVVNVSNPASPSYVGAVDLTGAADGTGVAYSGTLAFVTRLQGTSNEVAIINILNILAPASLSGIDIAGDATDVVISGSNAYISTTANAAELTVVNFAVPLTPTTAGTLNTTGPTDATAVALSSTVGSEAWNSRDLKSRPH